MPFPVLETARLLVRPFALDDLEDLRRILDFELQWSGEPLTREDRQEVLEGYISAYELDVPCGWRAIVEKQDQRRIGMVRLNVDLLTPEVRGLFVPAEDQQAEPYNTIEYYLGYALSPGFWDRGFATEAARSVIQYAFEVMKLLRILAETSADNERSQKVMRRLGMRVVSAPRLGWPNRVVGLVENQVL